MGIIAAGHEETAAAGKVAFDAGGNAIDAAIAAMLASCVAEPFMSGLGGGGFAVVRTADGTTRVLDFFCQTPQKQKPAHELEFVPIEVEFDAAIETFHVGQGAVAVPGMARGIFELHQRLGSVPLELLAEPAIELAESGARVDWFQAYDFKILEPIFSRGSDATRIYYDSGRLLAEGDMARNQQLADTLGELITEGPDSFYRGEIAGRIVAGQQDGGQLQLADMENYSAVWRDPLRFEGRDYQLHTNPQPSHGGIRLVRTLEFLAVQSANPEFGNADYSRLIAEGLLVGLSTEPMAYTKWGSTTHISTADRQGNAISMSISNGEGSGCFIPGTGIQLNNMLGEAALFPQGFHSWKPDTRVPSMMSPVILEHGKEAVVALGSGGAGRIPAVLSQVLRNLVIDGVSLEDAIKRSRICLNHDGVELEPGIAAPNRLPHGLTKSNVWPHQSMFFGGVHAACVSGPALVATGDPRRNGCVARW